MGTHSNEKKSPKGKAAKSRNYLVVQSNNLIQATNFSQLHSGKSLTLQEQKILLYTISLLQKDTEEFDTHIIKLSTLCEIIGIEPNNGGSYNHIKHCIEKIGERVIWLRHEDGSELMVHLFARAKLYKNIGIAEIKLDDELVPYLLQLTACFTEYPLRYILRMRSKYGISLYQLLKSYSFESPKEIRFEVEELKRLLDATRYRFADLKRFVIDPGLKDINTYSDIDASVTYIKEGYAIKYIVFTVTDCTKVMLSETASEKLRRECSKKLTIRELALTEEYDRIEAKREENSHDTQSEAKQ